MGWISVNDRLPKKLEKVLFHWVTHGNLRIVSMGYMCDAGWNIYLPYHSYGLRADVCPVTHWRYLPDLPKYKMPEIKEHPVGGIIFDEAVYIMPPCEIGLSFPAKAHKGEISPAEWAKKFCQDNADLLKRLADR